MVAKFANELSLWGAMPETHLIVIATFGLDPTGVASIETIAPMVVTENWIPFESSHEAALLGMAKAMLTAKERGEDQVAAPIS